MKNLRMKSLFLAVALVLSCFAGTIAIAADDLEEEEPIYTYDPVKKHYAIFRDYISGPSGGYVYDYMARKHVMKRGYGEIDAKSVTIEEGATATMEGSDLSFDGILLNKGTLILNSQNYSDGYVFYSQATITGKQAEIINEGTIVIKNGSLIVRDSATLTNNGIIIIQNSEERLTGLSNQYRMANGRYQYGTVVNNGTIQVNNTGGLGINNHEGAVFENNGIITKGENGTTKGLALS